jgi:hypothetical protein
MSPGASSRRRAMRQFLCVIKTRTSRWRSQYPGGVYKDTWLVPWASLKATEGAEKSCRTRRRVRGLRKGKTRSREGKSRSNWIPPANVPNNPGRCVKHKVRMLDFHAKVAKSVVKRFEVLVEKGKLNPKSGQGWHKYEAQWDRIHKWALRDKLSADSCFGFSFVDFLENRVGVFVKSRAGVTNSDDSFLALMQSSGLKPRNKHVEIDRRERKKVDSSSRGPITIRRGAETKFCRGCGDRVLASADAPPCPTCYERQHGIFPPGGRGVSVMTIAELGRAYRARRT